MEDVSNGKLVTVARKIKIDRSLVDEHGANG
eukprot:CAMPEP_0118936800 /NCGR_PEP_ID=MMETSP1169-20130426/20483_1 /TAXON_ID=36882 /ORGANISM="Pyramimonas obovata, Strain CCMP722" /LENGTH=30 /DNA_ID= /DNA_START= /DNA_END= /DNA_ORIENTATION=